MSVLRISLLFETSHPWALLHRSPLLNRIPQGVVAPIIIISSLPPTAAAAAVTMIPTCPLNQDIFFPINSANSSSNSTVSAGLAIHAVVPTLLALKSFAPALRNWSPTCRVFSALMIP